MIHAPRNSVKPFDFDGLTIADYVPGKVDSGSIAEVTVACGARHRTARSIRSDKFYVCVEGRMSFKVGEQSVPLNPGDVLVIEKGEWFSYSNESEKTARVLLFHAPPFDLSAEEFRD